MFAQQSMPSTQCIPARVQAAQAYLYWSMSSPNDPMQTPRELSLKEQATYNAALEVLRLYFACEMDFGDVTPVAIAPPDDDQPKKPELAPAN